MDFYELIKKRASVRRFLQKPVERALIERCVDAARLAPSACNSQNWKFIVVDGEEEIKQLADCACSGLYSDKTGVNKLLYNAPVLVAIVNTGNNAPSSLGRFIKGTDYSLINIGIAGEHFVLQAEELGLNTCWVGWFNEKKVKKFLHVPKRFGVPCIIAVGYGDVDNDKRGEKRRKPLNEVISFGRYE